MGSWVATHRKLIVAVAGGLVAVADAIWGSGNPYVITVVALLTSAGVYQVPNQATGKTKPV